MKKTILAICALIPVIAYSADNQTPFIFCFSDDPGTYKIRVQSVNNVKDVKGARTYTSLTLFEYEEHEQQADNDIVSLFGVHQDATHVRISIRKRENGEFKRGGYALFAAYMLHNKAAKLEQKNEIVPVYLLDKSARASISMENQFENLVNGEYIPKIGTESILSVHS